MKRKMISSSALLNKLKGFFTRNLGLKIVALVFALLLWAYVLVALNPVRTKSINGVTITLEGYTDLLSRNLILVNSDLGLADVEVTPPSPSTPTWTPAGSTPGLPWAPSPRRAPTGCR